MDCFKEDEKEKRRDVVVQFELIFGHSCFHVVCACTEFFGEVGHFTVRSGFLELCVICEKLIFMEWLAMILERGETKMKRMGLSTEP